MDAHPTAEVAVPKTEDTNEDVLMESHSDPPLPLGRVESEHSASEYVLDQQITPSQPRPSFEFKEEPVVIPLVAEENTVEPLLILHKPLSFTLPPLKTLPPEFHRKSKQRQSRKRDKEKTETKPAQEWTPLGLNRWSAMLRANPVHKKVSRATKCLNTRDWNVAMTELKLIKTFERIDALIDAGRWSFRQPKKQRGVGGLLKTHWDYLLDEMKWMRIDFREERKWKTALAYNLAHAVVEWHEAGTLEERVRRGICVLWKRPRETEVRDEPENNSGFHAFVQQEDIASGSASKAESTPMNEDNSDDDSDEEQERDQQDVIDALDPSTTLQEALDDAELLNNQSSPDIRLKEEEVDDTSALRHAVSDMAMQMDSAFAGGPSGVVLKDETAEPSGLKISSGNPMLTIQAEESESASASAKTKSRNGGLFAPLREEIINADLDKLFLDLDDFDLVKAMSSLSTDEMSAPPPLPDLSEIFPDAQPFGLLDVPPPPGSDGKKRSGRGDKDDPNKRTEDTTYMKVLPANDFMFHKATLLGPLQPSRHYHDDVWHDLDESAILVDELAAVSVDERSRSALFTEVKGSPSSTSTPLPPPKAAEFAWTSQDDTLLEHLVKKYPSNWFLISEAFNSLKGTSIIDRRSAADCFERFRSRHGAHEEDHHRPPPQTPTTMTTRGTKRSMSMSVSASNLGGAGGGEPKKRRRHNLMYEAIRKATKKREALQKQAGAQNRPVRRR
ncbi:hypothetical protein PHLGIDRAFT_104756 [Phlebiopsis gigantea 11061_1 CR5-6]|uniref:Vacuolar import and degradation protein 21 n=1 Tax=Phlebiopsis gigantea (strain 11061_1 CR5-6) TaxID=745531 RepID=A0A0C3PN39_PHLG1|nr:hypothetical protein PHLGIDRAFT_104756 [Phlebiopsis gigantea 11061_1 CR5-6]